MTSVPPSTTYLIRLLLAMALIFCLIVLEQILVPLFFAILFAYLLYPAAEKLERAGIPRVITNLVLILSSIAAIGGFIYLIGFLVANFADGFSEIREQFKDNVEFFMDRTGSVFGLGEEQLRGIFDDIDGVAEYVIDFFTATTNTIVAFGLMPVYTFLLLLYRNKFREVVEKITPERTTEMADRIVDQIAKIVPRYLKGLIVVVLILMVVNSTVFWLAGIEYAILIGVIAALFNLIPYLGTVLGYAAALFFVLATQSPALALWVFILFFPVQFFENNILTPNITGSYVRLNPLVIILALLCGALLWNLPGMLLVIPYLAMFKIVCDNIESLQPIGYLISTRGTEEFTPSAEGIKKKLFFWRG
jgi:predicted PurR-regulated permease PerM